jgi:hypothetical protein
MTMTTTVQCPQCGRKAEVAPGEQPFCRGCDYPLFWVMPRARPVEQLSEQDDSVSAGSVQCAICRAINPVERTLCIRCAEPLMPAMPRQRRQWSEPTPAPEPLTRRQQIVRFVLMGLGVILFLTVFAALVFYFLWPRHDWVFVDLDSGEASWDVSATQVRGVPVISYVNASDLTVRIVICGNATCDHDLNAISHNTLASLGTRGAGSGTSVAVGSDGYPVVAFRHGDRRALMVAHCGDPLCRDRGLVSVVEVDPGAEVEIGDGDTGIQPSMVIGTDGLPIIAYYDRGRGALKIAHCQNSACSDATIAILDRTTTRSSGGVGLDPVIRVGPDGLPIVAFRDDDQKALKLARCSDPVCTRAVVSVLIEEFGRDPGHSTDMVLAPGGVPVLVHADWSDNGIWLAACSDAACSAVARKRLDVPADGTSADPSVTLDGNHRPIVTFRQKLPGDERASRILKIVRCGDPACSSASGPSVVDDNGRVGYVSTVLWLPDGEIAIAYGDATGGVLKFAVKVD